MDQMAIVHHR
jgi:hypothetical protein